jgi:hypothetical protein
MSGKTSKGQDVKKQGQDFIPPPVGPSYPEPPYVYLSFVLQFPY